MKKGLSIILGVAFLAAMMTFTSCKKDYTCTCTFTNGTSTLNIAINKAKKKDAQSTCDAAQTTYRSADPGAACTLK
jgi:histone acetyltransferase (RNA polymerase elongator complex component)